MAEKERNIDLLFIYWLILVCALTREQTPILDASGQHSNQPSYPAWAKLYSFLISFTNNNFP